MQYARHLPFAFLALAAAAHADSKSLHKSFGLGDSTFGVEADASATIRLTQNDTLKSEGDFSFRTRLFGASRGFDAEIDCRFGNSKSASAEFTGRDFLGNTFSIERSRSYGANYRTHDVFDETILELERQFTVWGVPVIVILDVNASGHLGYAYDIDAPGVNWNDWRNEQEIYVALRGRARLTAGPGSGLAGFGVYGRVEFGDLKLAIARTTPYFGAGDTYFEGQLELDMGDFEIGVRAWIAGIEEEVALMNSEGCSRMLKRVRF